MIPDYFLTVRLSDAGEPRRASDERGLFPGSSPQAGDRARTGDIQLGRLALYQLSYTRVRLA
jgi:hypothetical protein